MILPQVLGHLARITPIKSLARAAVASAILCCDIAGFAAAQVVDRPVCEALMALEPKNFHFSNAIAGGPPSYRINVGKAGIGSYIELRTGFSDPSSAPVNVPIYIIGANAADRSFMVSKRGGISLKRIRNGNFPSSFNLEIVGEAHGRFKNFRFDSLVERGVLGDVIAKPRARTQGGDDFRATAYFVNHKEVSEVPISQLVRHEGDWRTHSTYALVLRLSDSCSAHPTALAGNPPDGLSTLVLRASPALVADSEIDFELISSGETIRVRPVPGEQVIAALRNATQQLSYIVAPFEIVRGRGRGVEDSGGPLNPRPVNSGGLLRLTKGPLEWQITPSGVDGLPGLGAISTFFAPVREACTRRFLDGAVCAGDIQSPDAVAATVVTDRPGGRMETDRAQWTFDLLRFETASMNGRAWDIAANIHETCQAVLEVDLGDREARFALSLEETAGRPAWSLDAAAIQAGLGEGAVNAFNPEAEKALGLDNPELSLSLLARDNAQSPDTCLAPEMSLDVEPMGVRDRTAFFAVRAPMAKPMMVVVFKPRGLSTLEAAGSASRAVQLRIFALTRRSIIEILRGFSAAADDGSRFQTVDIRIASFLEGGVRLNAISDAPAPAIIAPRYDHLPVMGYTAEFEFARAMAADDAGSPEVLAAATGLFDPETTIRGAAELTPHHLVLVEFHDNLGAVCEPAQTRHPTFDSTRRDNDRPIRQTRIVGVVQSHRALDAAAQRMPGTSFFWTCPETRADAAVELETAEVSASIALFSVSELETNADLFSALRNDTLLFLTRVFQDRRRHTAEDGSGAVETIIGSR